MQDIKKQPSSAHSGFSPENLIERIWQELRRAPHDRHHDWKRPALASVGLDGTPQARTVILRDADVDLWALTAYTDARSAKCAELIQHGAAQLVFWSARLNWQLRVTSTVLVHTDGIQVSKAWAKVSQTHASKDYLSELAPGSVLLQNHGEDKAVAKGSNVSNGDHHLAVLSFQVQSIDWLALGREGHCRARIFRDGPIESLTP